jgi:DNA-directed RNA polymerase subunit H (RpoH/RPB5)
MVTGQEKNSTHYLTVFLVLNINGKYSHSPELRKLLDSVSSEYKTSLYELIIIADELFFTKKSLLDIIKDYQKGKNNEFQIIYNAYPYHNFVMNIPLSESIPVHRIMTQKEIEKNIISEHIKISDLHIIYSNDPPIIWLGGKEGQVVEIQRKSVTSGIAINYRRIEKRI